jgi:hypothetical protein
MLQIQLIDLITAQKFCSTLPIPKKPLGRCEYNSHRPSSFIRSQPFQAPKEFKSQGEICPLDNIDRSISSI